MEQTKSSSGVVMSFNYGNAGSGGVERPSFVDSVLTDAVLSELKKQSINGCLLCSFDTWDEEEWD